MLHAIGITALLAYLAAAVGFLAAVFRRHPQIAKSSVRVFQFAFVFHTLSIGGLITDIGFGSLDNGGDFYLWVSWIIAGAFCFFPSAFEYPIFGSFVAPVTAMTMVSSSYLLHQGTALPRDAAEYIFLGLHLFPALVSEASLVLSCIVSIVFLLQERRIKRKQLDSFNLTGPSLELVERLNARCVTVGFVAMTLAVMSGSVWGLGRNQHALFRDPYQWAALLVWIGLGWIIHSRLNLKLSARRLSTMTVWVTGLFVISFFLLMMFTGKIAHGNIAGS